VNDTVPLVKSVRVYSLGSWSAIYLDSPFVWKYCVSRSISGIQTASLGQKTAPWQVCSKLDDAVSCAPPPLSRTTSTRARGRSKLVSDGLFSRSFLRSDKFWLQNSAIPWNAARIGFVPSTYEKQAVQSSETLRNSLGLNYKSAALNQLSYAGVSPDESCFQRLIKSSSWPISGAA